MSAVRVVREVPCPRCAEHGWVSCQRCHGNPVYEPVTCAGCKHFDDYPDGTGYCNEMNKTQYGDFACAAWEPRAS